MDSKRAESATVIMAASQGDGGPWKQPTINKLDWVKDIAFKSVRGVLIRSEENTPLFPR